MTQTTFTQHMVATDANPDDLYTVHSVGVDSSAGLYVIDPYGEELSFSLDVMEQIHEALGEFLKGRVD